MSPRLTDENLSLTDLRELASADALAALFSRLGYNTNARLKQSAPSLGMTEELAGALDAAELLSEDGPLRVYFFKLKNVTKLLTDKLTRSFKGRGGRFLVVLTDDFDALDFILLTEETTGQQRVSVALRHKIFPLDRRNPGQVALRVLRRLSYTEQDPYAQWDKLKAAFDTAEWTEIHFNNRRLFTDHYLNSRLPESEEWKEEPRGVAKKLDGLCRGAAQKFGTLGAAELETGLVLPVLQALGYEASAQGEGYRLHATTGGSPLLELLVYRWNRLLDAKVDDPDKGDQNPSAKVVSVLQSSPCDWAIVTNGKIWRLYSKQAHSRATNFYEIDLEELLAQERAGDAALADGFRYFWLLFRAKSHASGFVTKVLKESQDYAKELGDRLKRRVFEDVFPALAQGFIAHMKAHSVALDEAKLEEVKQGTLLLLYRLLFLLYAEALDLLPLKEQIGRGYEAISLRRLCKGIAAVAGLNLDQSKAALDKAYKKDAYDHYGALRKLFTVVNLGDPAVNVPKYNGGLFADPSEDDEMPELAAARFLKRHKVDDRRLAEALDLLARAEDEKTHELVPVDYKSLGVRQLGSIYEGLLEYKVQVAGQKLVELKDKNAFKYEPFADLDEKQQAKALKQNRVIPKGGVYLANDKAERKASGSYYTPDYIVEYIVANTVGPALDQKLEALRGRFREAEAWHFQRVKQAAAKGEDPAKYKAGPAVENAHRELVEDFFNFKVLDPAMGSGHFLVEAVDFITDKAIAFLDAFPWNPVLAHLEYVREQILDEMDKAGINLDRRKLDDINLLKRHVLKRCIYGVDLNPMAVELAKVSLWLDCFTLGAPLSFLDHHLRCGNSLVGATVAEVEAIREAAGQLTLGATGDWQGMQAAVKTMIEVGGLPDVTPGQAETSRQTYRGGLDGLESFKRVLNVQAGRRFVTVEAGKAKQAAKKRGSDELFTHILRNPDLFDWAKGAKGKSKKANSLAIDLYAKPLAETQVQAYERRFFHWDLEFPEVFFNGQGLQAEGPGFDAVIGNPPYVRQEDLGDTKPFLQAAYADVYAGMADLYVYFYALGLRVCRKDGYLGLVTSNKFTRAGYGEGLRTFLARYELQAVVDFRDLPVFEDASAYPLIILARQRPMGPEHRLKGRAVADMQEAQRIGSVMAAQSADLEPGALRAEGWVLQDTAVLQLLDKLRQRGRPLGEVIGGKFYYGIKTGFNDAFVIDEAKRQELIKADPKSAEIIKPFLRGRDIKRWKVEWAGRYLIFTRRGIDIERYPAVRKHLERFKKQLLPLPENASTQLKENWEGRKVGTYEWFELQDSVDYFELMDHPKIVYNRFQVQPIFAFDEMGTYHNDAIYFCPDAPKWLVGFLNSPLGWFLISNVCTPINNGFQLLADYLGRIPIVVPSDVSEVVRLVDVVKDAKGKRLVDFENKIYNCFFEACELDESEKRIVLSFFRKQPYEL